MRLIRSLPVQITVIGTLVVLGLGAERFLEDGSFYLDEATVARSLVAGQGPVDMMRAAGNDHTFPRVYLAAINALEDAFGLRTWLVRALPFLFFVLATILWSLLFYLRLRDSVPLLIAALLLMLVSDEWPLYGAMLKQYSLDVFLVLAIFVLPDRYYEDCLRRGERRWLLLLLTAPCMLSYTYGIALLGRVLGWMGPTMMRSRDRFRAIDGWSLFLFSAGTGLFALVLWWVGLRHTVEKPGLFDFWSVCILGQDWSQTFFVLDGFVFNWYRVGQLPWPFVRALEIAFVAGVVNVGRSLLRPSVGAGPAGWGSRSSGAAVALGGVLAASLLLDYPLCAGRLTLFVLALQQLLIFEGFSWGYAKLSGHRWAQPAFGLLLVACLAPTAYASSLRFIEKGPTDDIRPWLETVSSRPDLPIYVTPCLFSSVDTLPEGFGNQPLVRFVQVSDIPWGETVWVLDMQTTFIYCAAQGLLLEREASSWQPLPRPPQAAVLVLASFPDGPGE